MSVSILIGDAVSRLRELPDESVHCCVTSPPYWGLRSYGGDPGMIGLEPTFDEHLANLVAVFREVRRVLRKDGTLWLNYGDAYNAGTSASRKPSASVDVGYWQEAGGMGDRRVNAHGLKPKDLMMMPARVALALQADGWWLRSEIIWHKPNPMPESCTDRPTSAHEKLYLLSRSARYFYDAEAVRVGDQVHRKHGYVFGEEPNASVASSSRASGHGVTVGANLRNVWTADEDEFKQFLRWKAEHAGAMTDTWKIATHAYSAAHFATFPPALVDPCIKAGTSEKGVCGDCGAPWVREVEKQGTGVMTKNPDGWDTGDGGHGTVHRNDREQGKTTEVTKTVTTCWSPSCTCDAEPIPATVLDPFAGSGTVGLVSDRLQRNAILIEINPEYAAMARKRIDAEAGLFSQTETTPLQQING